MRNKRFGKLLSAALAAAMALSLSSAALAAGRGLGLAVPVSSLGGGCTALRAGAV